MELELSSPDHSSESSQHLQVLSDIRESPLLLATHLWDAPAGSQRLAFGLSRVGQLILEIGHQGST